MSQNKISKYTELSDLIRLAKGEDRSLRKYAEDSGVSVSNIARIVRNDITRAPSIDILKRLTSASAAPRNDITLERLCIAAGYQAEPQIDQLIFPDVSNAPFNIEMNNTKDSTGTSQRLNAHYSAMRKINNQFETMAKGILLTHFSGDYRINITKGVNRWFDMEMISITEPSKHIYFEFKSFSYREENAKIKSAYDRSCQEFIGRAAVCDLPDLDSTSIYYLVTDTKPLYNAFKVYAGKTALNINFSVMLIDMDKCSVLDEFAISQARALKD